MTSVLVFNAKLITGIHLALNDNHSLIKIQHKNIQCIAITYITYILKHAFTCFKCSVVIFTEPSYYVYFPFNIMQKYQNL